MTARHTRARARWPIRLLLVAGALAVAYLLATWAYWPSMPPAVGVRQPLHYNESYVWPRPWTLAQAAPRSPGPAPAAVLWGSNSVSQSFTACADNLAMVRIWLAPAGGISLADVPGAATVVRVTLLEGSPGDGGWPVPLYSGPVQLEGRGRYVALTFPPIRDAEGRRFLLRLETLQGAAAVRVGYVDAVGGLLSWNEVRTAGDLDFGAYYRGWPGDWTLRAIGERVLPHLALERIGQYKPAWAKGAAFAWLAAALGAGSVALLWLSWPGAHRGRAAAGTALLLLGTVALLGWRDVGAAIGIGERRVSLDRAQPGSTAAVPSGVPLLTHDLVAGLEFAGRRPEPRQVKATWVQLGTAPAQPAIVAPGTSRVGYRLDLLPDAELRFRYAWQGAGGRLAVYVGDDLAWQALTAGAAWQEAVVDLRPWAGQAVSLALVAEGDGRALWGDPQVVSARTWLLPYPLSPEMDLHLLRSRLAEEGGGEIELLGYAITPAGGALDVTLYWRALRPVAGDYTVFVHALDAEGQGIGQRDERPVGGTYPTSAWPAEYVVMDRHRVPVTGVPARLAVGLYDLRSMARLPARQEDGTPWMDGQVMIPSGLR